MLRAFINSIPLDKIRKYSIIKDVEVEKYDGKNLEKVRFYYFNHCLFI